MTTEARDGLHGGLSPRPPDCALTPAPAFPCRPHRHPPTLARPTDTPHHLHDHLHARQRPFIFPLHTAHTPPFPPSPASAAFTLAFLAALVPAIPTSVALRLAPGLHAMHNPFILSLLWERGEGGERGGGRRGEGSGGGEMKGRGREVQRRTEQRYEGSGH